MRVNLRNASRAFALKVVSDPEYMVAIKAVKMKRQVEMFQWVEHKSERSNDSFVFI